MIHQLTSDESWFPPVTEANDDGLLAFGGTITENRILNAYAKGIFPWYEEGLPLWYSPDPRFVLFPSRLIISKSMKSLFKKSAFEITINKSFEHVIEACGNIHRKGQAGTWINNEIKNIFIQLNKKRLAVSIEAWKNGKLAGGLYGLFINNVFFGESMFSYENNASKYAFIQWVIYLNSIGCNLIDCQVYSNHLKSLGAEYISRKQFVDYLKSSIPVY